jgi:hypothetical protein
MNIMKNKSNFLLGLLIFGFCLVHFSADAQRSRVNTQRNTDDRLEKADENRTEDQVPLIDKLWFGGSVNFFWANQRNFSQLLVGIAPMVGYKVTDKLSFGPRIEVQYTSYKFQTGSGDQTANNLNFGGFGFGRYKIFRRFFIHVESGFTTQPYLTTDSSGNLDIIRELRQPVLAGLGYTEGGGEIYLLYDFNDPDETSRFPFQYRFGFNYNF